MQTTLCACICVLERRETGVCMCVSELQQSRWKVRATVASGGDCSVVPHALRAGLFAV